MRTILILSLLALIGCQSDLENKQAERQAMLDTQIELCKQDIVDGKEPSRLCAALASYAKRGRR